MEIKVKIDDKELQEEITRIIANKITSTYSYEQSTFKREIANAVKETIYSEKQFIIDAVIARATTEIVKKAMPKLIDKMID